MAKDLNIEVKAEGLTWGDARLFTKWQMVGEAGNVDTSIYGEIADFFDRVVVGGANVVPIMHTAEVFEAIFAQMNADKNAPAAKN